jgi:hypothetical protein
MTPMMKTAFTSNYRNNGFGEKRQLTKNLEVYPNSWHKSSNFRPVR